MASEGSTLGEQAVSAYTQTGTRIMNFFNGMKNPLPQDLQFPRNNFSYDKFMGHNGQWTEMARTPNFLQKNMKDPAIHTFTPRRYLTNYSITQGNKTVDGLLSHVPGDQMSFGLLPNGAMPVPLPFHMAGFYDEAGQPATASSNYSYAVMTHPPHTAWVLARPHVNDRNVVSNLVQKLRSHGYPVNIFHPSLDLKMNADGNPVQDAVAGKLADVAANVDACCIPRVHNDLYDDLVGCGYESCNDCDSGSDVESEVESKESKSKESKGSKRGSKKYYKK